MTHRTLEPTTDRLQISVLDKPGTGGASHLHSCLYQIRNMDASNNPAWDGANQHSVLLLLQNGPLSAGKPANGLTEEAVLTVIIDRLRSFNETVALQHCEAALAALKRRAPEFKAVA